MNNRTVVQQQKATLMAFTPMPSGLLQRKCACGGTPGIDGECAECRAKRLQRKAISSSLPSLRPTLTRHQGLLQRCTADGECTECRAKRLSLQRGTPSASSPQTVPPIVHDVLGSPGHSLDAGTSAYMEQHFGHDFSSVRVHTDAKAAESARAVKALAYTVGENVVFGTGLYAPETRTGQKLLAHELTHVVQQQGAASSNIQKKLAIGEPDDTYEREAEAHATSVIDNNVIQVKGRSDIARVQRQADPVKVDPAKVLSDAHQDCAVTTTTGPEAAPHATLSFRLGSSDLSSKRERSIKADSEDEKNIADFVTDVRSRHLPENIRIDGYASTDGHADRNWILSCERATAAKNELVTKHGIQAAKIKIFAHGPTKEFSVGETEADRAKNRIAILSTIPAPAPTPPAPPSPTPPTPSTCKPSPIDLTKIPNVMDSKGWTHGAALLREWFTNPAGGGPVDATTITMDWVLKFARAKEVYDSIFKEKVYVNKAAQGEINNLLKRLGKDKGGVFDFAKPVTALNPDFDINFKAVGSIFDDLDDLTTALGRFTFRMVVGGRVEKDVSTGRFQVIITDVGVHVRDSFDFNGSQPLGCWNVCTNEVGRISCGGGVSVGNADFRDFRKTSGKGGDFTVLSDVKATHLSSPESFFLP